jgi:membrane-associated protease RseP (regulator of RpoE activity)
MQKIRVFLAGAALLSASSFALAQAHDHQVAPPKVTFAAHSQSVPFELFRGNRIIVPAKLNGHQTEVLLDTGASATTLDRAYARSIGLPEGRKVTATGAGGTVDAEVVSGVTLEVGGMRFENMTVAVMDLSLVSRGIGRPANVVLGREFFNSAVVSIDWAASRLQVSAPQAFTPGPGATELKLSRIGPFNTIPVSIAGGEPIKALLDLGNGGALSLPRTYWGERRELAGLRFAESRRGGVGGLTPARAALVPSVTLAGRTFANVPAILSEGGNDHDAEKMANVGVGLLKQFHVDLDLGRDRIYLAPRTEAAEFDRDRSGTRLELVGDRLRVAFVSPQGPAKAAGLREGDEIVAVDGHKVTADYYRARDWTRGPAGQAVALQRADGTRVSVTLQDYY